MKNHIFILFVLMVLCGTAQASQKRKLSDDIQESQVKKNKVDLDEVIKQLNDELSRYRTKEQWPTRKQKIVQAYEQYHFDLNKVIYRDRSITYNPLSQAVDYSDQEFVHWLLERGMNAQATNFFDEPVICRARNIAIVQDLIEHGANVNSVNNYGEPLSLHAVMEHYDPELVQLYGAYGRATIMNPDPGATPLARLVMHATSYRTKALAQLQSKGRFLIEGGANITDPIYEGKNFDQLVNDEITALRMHKSDNLHEQQTREKNIKKLEALSQEVHQASEKQQQRKVALSAELDQALPQVSGLLRHLIASYTL